MFNIKYSLIIFFAIALIIMLWIIFTSFSEKTISTPTDSQSFVDVDNSYEIAANSENSRRHTPRDNDASYTLPTYIPTHNHSMPPKKIEFKEMRDNDELYYTPVAMPKNAPKRAIVRQAPTPQPARQYDIQPVQPPVYQTPVQPVAPLQPQAPQPQVPTYVPQYQQYQQPAYQAPAAQQPQTEQEEYYPYYYY